MACSRSRGPSTAAPAARAVVGWLGLAAIGVACVAFSARTPLPGAAALLPVSGALAVIWAGSPGTRWAATRGLGLRPVQYVGDISYGIYLWHWPLLLLGTVRPARPRHRKERSWC